MQKGLDLLLEKYSVSAKASLSADAKTVTVDGVSVPLLPWESERRFIELRLLVLNGRLGNMCTYHIGHTAKKGTSLFELLAREVGILEFTVDSKAKEIFAIAGKNTMNCIVETENGCVCTIELGATHALMSGSGPTVFGIFTEEKKAEAARKVLEEKALAKQLFVTGFCEGGTYAG